MPESNFFWYSPAKGMPLQLAAGLMKLAALLPGQGGASHSCLRPCGPTLGTRRTIAWKASACRELTHSLPDPHLRPCSELDVAAARATITAALPAPSADGPVYLYTKESGGGGGQLEDADQERLERNREALLQVGGSGWGWEAVPCGLWPAGMFDVAWPSIGSPVWRGRTRRQSRLQHGQPA